jgi:transposase
MGADHGLIAGESRPRRRNRPRQPPIRRSGYLSLPRRNSWRDLPERFGDWKNTHRRFSRWAKAGVWERVFERLASEADNEYAMIDSTIVRADQHSAGAPKKR